MQFLSGLALYLEKFCKAVLVILFIVMVIVTFSNVILRIFSTSLSWSAELSRYCLIWLTFIGGALGVRARVHVAVEALTRLLPERTRLLASRINYLLIMIFASVLVFYGSKLSIDNIMYNQLSPALQIPIGLVYAAVPAGGLLILIFALEMLVNPGQQEGDVAE